ncbi:MAG: hypothetical protein ACE5G5_05535 [Candidatus Methylomirabilales bacterium]
MHTVLAGTLFLSLLLTGPMAWAEPVGGATRHLALYVRYQYQYEGPKEKSHEQPPRMRNLLEDLLASEISPSGAHLELLAFTKDSVLTPDDRLRGEAWLRAIDFGIDDVLLLEGTFRLALRERGGTADLSGVINYLNVAQNQVVRRSPFSLREEIFSDSPLGFKVRQLFLQEKRAYSSKDLAAALLAAAERRLKARMGELIQQINASYTPEGFPTLQDPALIETLWQAAEAQAALTGDLESARNFTRRLREHFPGISQAEWERRMERVGAVAAANAFRKGTAHAARETRETQSEDHTGRAQPSTPERSEAQGVVQPSQMMPEPADSPAQRTGEPTASHPTRGGEAGQESRGSRALSPLDRFRGIQLETSVSSVKQKYRLSRAPLDNRAAPAYMIDFDPREDLVRSIRLVAPGGKIAKITVLFSRSHGKMRHWAFPTTVELFSEGYGLRPSTKRDLTLGPRRVGWCAEWEDGETTVTLNRFDDIGLGQPLSPPVLILAIFRQSDQRGVLDGCSRWDEIATASR